ncbi:MAG: DinB family protein [Candidatus Rokubacteria bacterium]|nr:DinB family protein [Candidatus Rokubacteria bacterium]
MAASTAPLAPAHAAALLHAAAAALRAEVTALPAALLAWHPAAGEWCAKEVLGHLIEAEQRGFAGRVRQILESREEPRFTAWDQAAVARARRDCAREAAALLDELGALREASVALVAGLRAGDLGRGGHHPTVGYLTIADLLHEWVHHDRNHLKQLLASVQAFVWPHMGNAQRFSEP